ncbi:hypothetical protein [Bacillus sp. AM1(2019)]|uniref:hypothetical protein n=1 Tax=Bacillus sp. AM1(2019) TaxID=2665175 RepID=UPI0013635178|nr:hypothetical protein [Bacillus sp. AM1(2019)]QHJ03719.1 hypothetical protein GNE05_10885 [Bacillus sp. AM1(2019)]
MNKKQLVEVLRTSLPSKRILDLVDLGIVQLLGEPLLLKVRSGYSLSQTGLIEWNENKGCHYNYNELSGKKVIFGFNAFNRRGQEAIEKYLATYKNN